MNLLLVVSFVMIGVAIGWLLFNGSGFELGWRRGYVEGMRDMKARFWRGAGVEVNDDSATGSRGDFAALPRPGVRVLDADPSAAGRQRRIDRDRAAGDVALDR